MAGNNFARMTSRLITIGKTKAIILPQTLLEHCDIKSKVSVQLKNKQIILTAITPKRNDWDKAFKEMAANGDDSLEMPDVLYNEQTDDWIKK